MSDSEVISATDASRGFSDLLHKVAYQGQSFVIKKGNRVMAKIVPADEVSLPKIIKPARKTEKKSAPSAMQESLPAKPPKSQTIAAVKNIPPAKSSSGMSVPEGLTQDDVDFYQDLIGKISQG